MANMAVAVSWTTADFPGIFKSRIDMMITSSAIAGAGISHWLAGSFL